MAEHRIGDILFRQTVPGATRARLAAFSEGTEDPNPIHVDEAFAKAAGFPSVLQQGPMTTAHFARLLAERVGQDALRVLDVSFTAPVFPGEPLTLTATVEHLGDEVRCALEARKADGTITATGTASFVASNGKSPRSAS